MVRKRSPVQSRSQARGYHGSFFFSERGRSCETSSRLSARTASAGITRQRRTRRSIPVAWSTRSFAAGAPSTRRTRKPARRLQRLRGGADPAAFSPSIPAPGRGCCSPRRLPRSAHGFRARLPATAWTRRGFVTCGLYVSSSIGRAAVSKTAGWGFDSLLAWLRAVGVLDN